MSLEPQPKSKFLLYTIPAILLIAFAALVFWRVQARLRVQAELIPVANESNEVPVVVMHPARAAADQDLTLPGNVQAFMETPIYARTNGYLKKWYVDIGGKVKAGQLLAEIDTPEVEQQLHQAEAAELQARASMDLAKSTAERWQNLLKSDGVSQQEVDQNNAAYKVAQANVNAAEANVERFKYLQSFQKVTAPFDGVLTARNVDTGALISDGNSQQLFRLAQINVLRVYVNVPESYSNDITPGITTQLHIAEFPNSVFAGKVVHTAGAIDPTSRTLLTEIQVPNAKNQLMPGSYTQVKFHLHTGVVPLLIPSTALIFRAAGAQVAIVDSDDKLHLRGVTIGRDFGNNLEILSGLDAKDEVVVNPPDSITEGDRVSIQAQPATAAPTSQAPQQPAKAKDQNNSMLKNSGVRPSDIPNTGRSARNGMRWLPLTALAATVLITGCKVGPNYSRPTVETPAAWKEQPPDGWKTATPSDDISKGNWWEIFGQPELNDLETQAIAANQTLKAAAQRVIEARDTAKITRSQQFPQISAAPSLNTVRESANRPTAPHSVVTNYQSNTITLPADVSYEVDLWGSIRRSLESSNALTQASIANYENVLLTLKSDVAEYYIMVRFIDQELQILKNNIDLQQKAFDLTQSRHAGGVASGLDVAEAETQLDTTEGNYIGLQVQRTQFEHALAVLLGKPPAEFSMRENPLDLQPPVLPPGIPSDLLERRPDIAAAERQMASTNALVGVARAAYYPTLNLSGTGGLLGGSFSRLFSVPSLIWGLGANSTAPLFTGGALPANLDRARATYNETVADYRQAVLTAFQQVEDGLSGLRVLEQQSAAYDKAVKSAQQTVDISTSRYREGLANFVEVIDAQETLLTNQRTSDQIQEQRLLTTVSLIQALGGGWQESKIYSSNATVPANVSSTAGSSTK